MYHRPPVNGAGDAFEALSLATLNVCSFAMMATGGVLYALDINSVEDMRRYVRRRKRRKREMLKGKGSRERRELQENVQ